MPEAAGVAGAAGAADAAAGQTPFLARAMDMIPQYRKYHSMYDQMKQMAAPTDPSTSNQDLQRQRTQGVAGLLAQILARNG